MDIDHHHNATWAYQALESNKRYQETLAQRASKLEEELEEVERLLALADPNTDAKDKGKQKERQRAEDSEHDPAHEAKEDEFNEESEGESEVWIPGAVKATGLFPAHEFLSPESPFFQEAQERTQYINRTTPRPFRPKDVQLLTDAVRRENQRLLAYKTQELPSSSASEDEPPADLLQNTEGLDWASIAEKVSDASSSKRTPTECRIAWLGAYHPKFTPTKRQGNAKDDWKKPELDQLALLVREGTTGGRVDWVDIAEKLGTGRTPIDCLRHSLRPVRYKWTPEADAKLLAAVEQFGIDNWAVVAIHVSPSLTGLQCQNRYTKSINPALRRGAWSPEEDALLKAAVDGYGQSWNQVSTCVPGRTNDQCRERFLDQLAGSDRGKGKGKDDTWSEEDDKKLLEAVAELGRAWKTVSARVGVGKTGQSCRVRYDKLNKAKAESPSTVSQNEQTDTTPAPEADAEPAQQLPTPKPKPKPRPTRKSSRLASS